MNSGEIILLAKIVSDLIAIVAMSKMQSSGMTEEQKMAYWQQQKELTDKLIKDLENV